MTALIVVFALLLIALQYRLNLWSRNFFDAFERRDGAVLRSQSLLFLLFAGTSITVAISAVWARMTMQRRWRAWLTRHLIERWLAKDKFHRLRFGNDEDANPEYRIAEDIRIATEAPVNLALGLLSAIVSGVAFIGILWNVGGDLAVDVSGHLLTVPKYLVLAVGTYSAFLTIGMTLIGHRMLRVVAGKNVAEAQFRAVASKVRESGDLTPLPRDGAAQHLALNSAFDDVIKRWRQLCNQWMRTTLISHGNSLAAPIIGWFLCAPKYLTGSMSLGEVAQAVAAFVMVQAALNWLVDNYPALADCMSSINRVAALLQAVDELD